MAAKLQCEICGGKLVGKPGGIFECENCGTEYSTEWAKAKIQEIKGTVKVEGTVEVTGKVQVDNSHLIQNYLEMAKNALDAGNNTEAENYCNKIIEIQPSSYEAWFVKGKAVGWQSTLANQRISETVNAFSKALDYCPEDKKTALANSCKNEIENLHKALLTARMKMFVNHPSDSDVQGLSNDVTNIMTNTVQFLIKAGVSVDTFGLPLATVICDHLGNTIGPAAEAYVRNTNSLPNDNEFRTFLAEIDRYISAAKLATILLGTNESDDLELYDTRARAYRFMVALNDIPKTMRSYDYNIDYNGQKQYYVHLTLTDEAIATRNKQNWDWKAEASKWERKKEDRRRALEAEKRRKEAEELEKKRRAEAEERARREKEELAKVEKYWSDRMEEKRKLEKEQENLQVQINEINNHLSDTIRSLQNEKSVQISSIKQKLKSVPGEEQLAALEANTLELRKQLNSLGLFKGKEKRELQAQIDSSNKAINDIREKMEADRRTYETEANTVKTMYDDRIAEERKNACAQIDMLSKKIKDISWALQTANGTANMNFARIP